MPETCLFLPFLSSQWGAIAKAPMSCLFEGQPSFGYSLLRPSFQGKSLSALAERTVLYIEQVCLQNCVPVEPFLFC